MNEKKIHNAADEAKIKEGKKKNRFNAKKLNEYYQDILKSQAGREVLWDLLEQSGVNGDCHSTDSHQTYFYLGQRKVGLDILRSITKADPMAYVEMLKARLEEESV